MVSDGILLWYRRSQEYGGAAHLMDSVHILYFKIKSGKRGEGGRGSEESDFSYLSPDLMSLCCCWQQGSAQAPNKNHFMRTFSMYNQSVSYTIP